MYKQCSCQNDPPMDPNVFFGSSWATLRCDFLASIPNFAFHGKHNVLVRLCYIRLGALSPEDGKLISSATFHTFWQNSVNKQQKKTFGNCSRVRQSDRQLPGKMQKDLITELVDRYRRCRTR